MGPSRGTTHVVVLRAPGNVERELNQIRSRLFGATGAVSTHALPPIFPIAYSDKQIPREVSDNIPQTDIPPASVGHIHADNRACSMEASITLPEPRPTHTWAAYLGVGQAQIPPEFPHPLSGFFLGAADLAHAFNQDDRELVAELDRRLLPKRIAVFAVELISVSWDASPWWTSVDWKVVWSRRIKLRGTIS